MRYSNAVAVAFLDQGRCPCGGCNGQLGEPDAEGWRRCSICRCPWKTAVIGGTRYAERVTNPMCETNREAATAARRTA